MPFTLEDVPSDEKTADLDALGDALTSEIPEPQQHAIDQAVADAKADPDNPQDSSVEVDKLGIPWNPEIHSKGADGKGILTAKGTWRKRRGLKGSASYINTDAASAAGAKKAEEDPKVTEQRTHEHQCRMAGAMAGTMLVRLSAGIGGEAFLPRTITIPGGLTYNEEQFLQTAFGDYFVAKGIVDIPPGMVLVSALSMYYLPRFQQPEVRAKGSKFFRWCKDKFQWMYFKIKYRGKDRPRSSVSADANRDTAATDSDIQPIRKRAG
jgi:hypothetical protein